ncbi:hypothetical protein [Paenibacillus odorifer]|uniref:hypothetical protein n=1 Tax=Paenibacillus odorifer TaxID=189426 RepID=UPI00289639CB|nr:hypothetical protein [Paenibacillus odorifer]
MHELSQQDFNEVKPLLTGAPIHPEILSIIEGNNPGWIFVDQLVTPKSALVWSKGMQGFYIIGDHTNEIFIKSLDSYVSSQLVLRMKKLGLEYFEVSGQHNEWNLALMFPSRKLYPFEQMVFKLFHKPVESLNNAIRIINLKMLEWEDLEAMDMLLLRELRLWVCVILVSLRRILMLSELKLSPSIRIEEWGLI